MTEREPADQPADGALPPEAPAAPPSCDARIAMKPEIREALEPTCCGSGCDDCPF